ncbi:MAG: tetratricopeptide (TPR) repeat protein [Vicingaceae bacterium]|jgi:tetratricopeptide (TPR) repeat protein
MLICCLLGGNSFAFYTTPQSDSIRQALKDGDYQKAKFFLLQVRDSIAPDNDSMQIEWLFRYSVFTSVLREYDSSFNTLTRALSLAQRSNHLDQEHMIKVQMIEWYRNIGQIEKGKQVVRKLVPDSIRSANVRCRYYHRAAALYDENSYRDSDLTLLDTALNFSLVAMEIAKQNNLADHQATIYNELGNIYEKLEENKLALENYQEAAHLLRQTNFLYYMNALKNIGGLYLRIDQYDSAIVKFNEVIANLDSDQQLLMQADTYWGLKNAYFGKGDSLKGLLYAVSEAKCNELLAKIEVERGVYEVTAEYDIKEKDLLLISAQSQVKNEKKRNKIYLFIFFLPALLIIGLLLFVWSTSKKMHCLKS